MNLLLLALEGGDDDYGKDKNGEKGHLEMEEKTKISRNKSKMSKRRRLRTIKA